MSIPKRFAPAAPTVLTIALVAVLTELGCKNLYNSYFEYKMQLLYLKNALIHPDLFNWKYSNISYLLDIIFIALYLLGPFYVGWRVALRQPNLLTFVICVVSILEWIKSVLFNYNLYGMTLFDYGWEGWLLDLILPIAGYGGGAMYSLVGRGAGATAAPASAASIDSNWRQKLIASLRATGVEVSNDRGREFALAMLGFLAIAVPSAFAGMFIPADSPLLTTIWTVFSIAVLARIRNVFLRRVWRARARDAVKELRRRGRPVFYLRSFSIDEELSQPTLVELCLGIRPLLDAEQVLACEMRKAGPMIAIGRPGEPLPPLGVPRFYVSDERWKEKAADVVRVAELVILVTGHTESLRWELSHLTQSLPPERLVLWAHPHLLRIGKAEREAEWTRFRTTLGTCLPRPLPETLGRTRFFCFTAEGEPVPISPATLGQRSAMRVLRRAKGYPRLGPKRRIVRWVAAAGAISLSAAHYGFFIGQAGWLP